MIKWKKYFFNPWFMTFIVVFITFGLAFFLTLLLEISFSYKEAFVSIIIPMVITPPFTLLFTSYINKLEQSKKEVERLNFANKKILSILSHDVRSPVATLKSLLNAMEEGTINQEQGMTFLSTLNVKTDNVLIFLDDLLEWLNDQMEQKPINLERISPKEPIEQILKLYDGLFTAKNLQVKLNVTDSSFLGDKHCYSYIVRNVIQNAIKYSHPNGCIEISTTSTPTHVITVVQDFGIGISKDSISKIFHPDEYFSVSGTKKEIGVGFGLKTSIQYLKKQNGFLEIESDKGKQTTVKIYMPKQ